MSSVRYVISVALMTVAAFGANTDLDWWQTSVIYQVYPRSFKDGDGNGVGDLKGVEEMAEHFNETGIRAIWLSPIFKSPMADFGYDISDFNSVDSTFGTMDDFLSLQKKLKSLGVRLLLDFVPNHSSNQHEWFRKSVQKIDPYTDYYVWKDGKTDENGNRVPPNNWRNYFDGSAWEWSSERGQYYLHQFTFQQPDLNYDSPALFEEMKNVLKFWLDLGVDGFRVDALPFMVEDRSYRDEPLLPGTIDDGYTYFLLDHIYTRDQPGTYKIVEEFRAVLDEYTNRDGHTRLMLTEAYATINYTMMYYSQTNPRAHMPFNFNFITYFNKTSSAVDIKDTISLWMDNMPEGQWVNWVVGNHDNKRVASRFGQEMVDPINTLVMMLPGTAITYNGEEIGMSDGTIRWEQTVDPWGRAGGPSKYEVNSRDPFRTPFQWNDSENGGFSTSKHTWLPVNSNYWHLNLAFQKSCARSHYQTYKKLVQLRSSSPTIAIGSLDVHAISDWVLIFTRKLEGHETFFIVLNVGTEQETITLKDHFEDVPQFLAVRSSSLNSHYAENDYVETTKPFVMRTKSSLVLSTYNEK